MFGSWAGLERSPACECTCEHNCCCCCCCSAAAPASAAPASAAAGLFFVPFSLLPKLPVFRFSSAAVAVLLQSPLVTSNAGVAEAACGAVRNLTAGDPENKAKLGAAGVCEGGYPLDACLAILLGW